MIATFARRLVLATLAALGLLAGGLPVLTGVAHAAEVTVTPNAVPNNSTRTFTIKGASVPLLASKATLTNVDNPSYTIESTSVDNTASDVQATFNLVNKLPG